jgi:hypothetical protein
MVICKQTSSLVSTTDDNKDTPTDPIFGVANFQQDMSNKRF